MLSFTQTNFWRLIRVCTNRPTEEKLASRGETVFFIFKCWTSLRNSQSQEAPGGQHRKHQPGLLVSSVSCCETLRYRRLHNRLLTNTAQPSHRFLEESEELKARSRLTWIISPSTRRSITVPTPQFEFNNSLKQRKRKQWVAQTHLN